MLLLLQFGFYNYDLGFKIWLVLNLVTIGGIIVMNQQHSGKSVIKNLIVLLLAISFFTLSLSEKQTVSAASTLNTSEPVELKWFVMGNDNQPDIKIVETAVNKYLKDKINATLNLTTYSWAEYENRIKVYMAAGETYDINFTSYWSVNYRNIANMGLYTDITDMLDEYAPKTKALLGDNILKGAEVDGRIYAIPTYTQNIINNNGILLNKKLVQKYKVDTSKIKKLEDLEVTFKEIKVNEPKIINFYPFDRFGSESVYHTLVYDKLAENNAPGAVLRDGKSTKVINDFETTAAKSLFGLMNKWYKSGYITKSTKDSYFFDENKANIFAMYSNFYPTLIEDIKIDNGIEMIPIELAKPSLNTNSITGSMQAISTSSKNPERALMFLELVNTDEKLSNMINYGIEGIHYKKTGAKTISQLLPRYEKYNPSSNWMFGNGAINYSLPDHNPKVWEKLKENTNKAVASPLLGFSFDSQSVKTEIVMLNNITNKYYNDLSMGKIDPGVNLLKMNNELKKAGLEKVLTEMQKQVDDFKSNIY